VTAYGMLGFWAFRAFRRSAVYLLRKWRFVTSLLIVALIAVTDETNQSFLASRTGSPWDVALDTSAGLTVIAIFFLWEKYRSTNI
jgi:VanZ family protein